jgi:hypothetical protein
LEQEYSKLFEATASASAHHTYFSTGEIRETASQFGIFGNISYSIDSIPAVMAAANKRSRGQSRRVKLQLSLRIPFLQTSAGRSTGRPAPYYDQATPRPARFHDRQPAILSPVTTNLGAGNPLLLVGRLADKSFSPKPIPPTMLRHLWRAAPSTSADR